MPMRTSDIITNVTKQNMHIMACEVLERQKQSFGKLE